MTHNALSRKLEATPMWVLQALLGIVLSGGVAWTTWATVTSYKHEAAIQVVQTKQDAMADDMKEIKDGTKELNQKVDRLLERRSR